MYIANSKPIGLTIVISILNYCSIFLINLPSSSVNAIKYKNSIGMRVLYKLPSRSIDDTYQYNLTDATTTPTIT